MDSHLPLSALPRLRRGVAVAVALLAVTPAQPAAASLTNAAAVARVYDAIFDAAFDRVPGLLVQTCGAGWDSPTRPPAGAAFAPDQACRVLDLARRWWELQADPAARGGDAALRRDLDATIGEGEAWTAREPARAEAWFYLGAAYGVRVQFRTLRGERVAAARDGKRIKDALERALALDPALQDAHFGIGLYRYYADVAPAAAKMLRWILWLPGGDREGGLRDMQRARANGQILRDEADYQLHVIDLWYEKQPERALTLVRGLQDRHPRNPLFAAAAADIEEVHLSDYGASLRTWQALLDDALARRIAWQPAIAEKRARLGVARQLDRQAEPDAAIEQIRAVLRTPGPPASLTAEALFQLGEASDHLGLRDEARKAFRDAHAAIVPGDPLALAPRLERARRQPTSPSTAEAARLSLEGWRALERGDVDSAASAIDRSLLLRPEDQVARYRKARVLLARHDDRAAIDLLEAVIAAPGTPPHAYAAACYDAAIAHERLGSTPRAIELYALTVAAFGVDPAMKRAAQRAITRLAKPA